jgi:hypothetical protein
MCTAWKTETNHGDGFAMRSSNNPYPATYHPLVGEDLKIEGSKQLDKPKQQKSITSVPSRDSDTPW